MIQKIAAIARKNLKTSYQQERLILKADMQSIAADFDAIEFIEKDVAEENENYKQLIPYIVLINEFDEIALYQRQGTEKRLHGLWSAGFGGHIESFELMQNQSIISLITKSAKRELSEEFSEEIQYHLTFKGIINEEQTKVGRTHIAWVFTAEVAKEMFEASGEISRIKWLKPEETVHFRKELWSELAIELIKKNIMARKVFISFLGTGNYVNTHHQFEDGNITNPCRFVQVPILDNIAKEWTNKDRIFIFLTDKAEEINWFDNGHKTRVREEIVLTGLKSILDTKPYGNICVPVRIHEGFNNEEIWENFLSVYDKINRGDEIYLDITHAFRSIPLFTNTLMNYARFLKGTKVLKIYYGAFEKLGPANEVINLDLGKRIAPILDITDIVRLQEWTSAASNFILNGKTNLIAEQLIESEINLNDNSQELKPLRAIQQNFETCRSKLIQGGNEFTQFRDYLKTLKRKNKIKPLNEIFDNINNEIDTFHKDDLRNVGHAIEWCFKYGMYQQAITMGQEYLLSLVVQYIFGNDKIRRKDYRTAANSFLTIDAKIFKNPYEWSGELQNLKSEFIQLMNHEFITILREPTSKSLINKEPMGEYNVIANLRNQINHGGVTDATKPDVFISGFKEEYVKALNKITVYIKNHPEKDSIKADQKQEFPCKFINLSNHPSAKWSEAQADAAEQFGSCTDLPFPLIDPEAGTDDINSLAAEYLGKILEIGAGSDSVTVHLMGEMTFTCALAGLLRQKGIRCVASTTVRETTDLGNGQKESVFRFVRFRDYY